MTNKKDIKILEEIIKYKGNCSINVNFSCNICPLQKLCTSYKIDNCTNIKKFNEAKKLLRKIKLEKILKIKIDKKVDKKVEP
jgi:hypothetical protein